MSNLTFDAIGTVWNIELPELDSAERDRIEREVIEIIDRFDKAYSRFRSDSLVTHMAEAAGTYTLPDDAEPMMRLYGELYDLTGGAFTPLIGRTISDAGYDAQYSFTKSYSAVLTTPPAWDETLTYTYPYLVLRTPALLDFGAAGKGYLVDLVAALLRSEGIASFIIDAGGDIRVEGEACVPIALEHPQNAAEAIGIATVKNRSICGSAGTRRTWGKYHHIIDPRTLESPYEVLATWVVADTAMLADALATCLYFSPPETFGQYRFEYLMLMPDYSVRRSPGFPAELFLSDPFIQ